MKWMARALACAAWAASLQGQPCEEVAELEVRLAQTDPPIAFPQFPVSLKGSVTRVKTGCGRTQRNAMKEMAWKVTGPAGEAVPVEGGNTALMRFTPSKAGRYSVTLTGCPAICRISLITAVTPTGKPVRETVELRASRTLTIDVAQEAQLPPLFTPPHLPSPLESDGRGGLRPAAPTTPGRAQFERARDSCASAALIGAGTAAQWYTTTVFPPGRPEFQLAEGRVYDTLVSRKDHPASHHSHDANAKVELDPHLRHLLVADTPADRGALLPFGGLEIEWERNELPEAFRPLQGDRLSALGYHVIDCGHEKYTEIHPPIAVAVHRPRAVALPDVTVLEEGGAPQRLGRNVLAAGIVTDVWVNLRGGQTLDCQTPGLHQPVLITPPVGPPAHPCVPQTPRTATRFRFRIYLPENPASRVKRAGLPEIARPALFTSIENHPEGRALGARDNLPMRIVERQLLADHPYVTVEVDLADLRAGQKFAGRVRAAWVYPDRNNTNFGLRALRVKLAELKVTSDGDPFLKGDGDWKFWAGLPVLNQPWSRLIDCGGCIEETSYGPGSGVFRPRQMSADGAIGGEVLLFGGQTMPLQFSGYEEDLLTSDDVGTVFRGIAGPGRFTAVSRCNDQTVGGLSNIDPSTSGCAGYTVTWEVAQGSTPVQAELSPEGRAFAARLVVRAADRQRMAEAPAPELYRHAQIGEAMRALTEEHKGEVEDWQEAVSTARLRSSLQPADAERLALELRRHALELLGPNPAAKHRQKVALELQEFRKALPEEVYRKHLCDLETGRPCPAE